jgi:hypothetical protein
MEQTKYHCAHIQILTGSGVMLTPRIQTMDSFWQDVELFRHARITL